MPRSTTFTVLSIVALWCRLPALASAHAADLYYASIPEDLYAFPKYRVAFINGLSLPNETAQRWLTEGLRGGEDEFLGRDWQQHGQQDSMKEIDGAQDILSDDASSEFALQQQHSQRAPATPQPSLQLMKLGPKNSYLCLIPPPPLTTSFTKPEDKVPAARSPSKSWELLQPMSNGCLYHVLGWFTYSYCHGKHVKQFREAAHAHPHPPGGRTPEEDPEWESYFLGVAPNQDAAELMSIDDIAVANKLELARGAGQRYLVQRWDDGTVCDKTGQPRKVEVQFHCSMTTTDKILLIKETTTCNYVVVIHTPRLCGEPGFKSERDTQEESVMRCREIISSEEQVQQNLLSSSSSSSASSATTQGAGSVAHGRIIEAGHPMRFPMLPPKRPSGNPHENNNNNKKKETAGTGSAASSSGGGGGVLDDEESWLSLLAKKQAKDASKSKQDHIERIRQALKAILNGDEEGGRKGGQDNLEEGGDSSDPEAAAVKRAVGTDNVIAVDGEDGEKVYFIVDNIEEVEDIDHLAGKMWENAQGAKEKARLDSIRKKLLDSLSATETTAGTKGSDSEQQVQSDSEPEDDSEDTLETHDEL